MMFSTTIAYLQFVTDFLPWIQNLDPLQTPGLFNGSLYHVLDVTSPGGTADVEMNGFNITCGYIPWSTVGYDSEGTYYNVSLVPASDYLVFSAPGNIRNSFPA
jgi:hypothetical protein